VDAPFSVTVSSAAWRQEVEGWIRERAAEDGREITGAFEQPRIRPWSTQLVVPTDRGRLWFKANCAALAFEPAVQWALADIAPTEVDRPVAIDASRGWMLTADRGTTLSASHEPTLDDWCLVVRNAALLQQAAAGHGALLLAAGLPDCSPESVPARLEDLVMRWSGLPSGHPFRLEEPVADKILAAGDRVSAAARALEDSPLPTTFQHGDLHPNNVFAVGGGLRIFDFGDAHWAHAAEVLGASRSWVTGLTTLPWRAIEQAYLEAWDVGLSTDDLEELLGAASLCTPVNRSLTWWSAMTEATDEEWQHWATVSDEYLLALARPIH
jgi:hypothetical protein